jgi:hypothetical protein
VITPATLAATFVNMDSLVGLCLQEEGNQYYHLL